MARFAKQLLPDVAPDAAPLVGLCINQEWLYILMNISARLEWGASWQAGTDIDLAEQRVFQLYALFRGANSAMCGDGCCDEILAKLNALQAGADAANMATYQQQQQQASALQQQLTDRYDGNPTSIHPHAPTGTFTGAGDADRVEALCAATAAFVRNFAARKAQQIEIVALASMVALGLAGILLPGLGWAIIAVAAVGIGSVISLVGVTTTAAVAALRDEAALDDVACCLKSGLLSAPINEAAFVAGLGGCGFAGGSNAAIVRDFVAAVLAENYLVFLDLLGTAYDTIQRGEEVYCPCPDEGWIHNWTELALITEWASRAESNSEDESDLGIVYDGVWLSQYGGGAHHVSISIPVPNAYTGAFTLQVEYTSDQAPVVLMYFARIHALYTDNSGAQSDYTAASGGAGVGKTMSISGTLTTAPTWIRVFIAGATFNSTQSIRVTRVTLSGEGLVDPFL